MKRVNQYSKDRIESFAITNSVLKMNVIYFMCITGYNFFASMYNDTIDKDEFIINLQEDVNKILN